MAEDKKTTAPSEAIRRARLAVSAADEALDLQQMSQQLLINSLSYHSRLAHQLREGVGYRRFIKLEHPEPTVLLNNITSAGLHVAPFIDFGGDPFLASARTPNIKIIKVYKDKYSKPVAEVEIPLFLYGTEKIVNRQDRSTEAFFRGLSFQLKDQTSFGASRMVQAQLKLGFNSFKALNNKVPATVNFLINFLYKSYHHE